MNSINIVHTLIQLQVQPGRQVVNKLRHLLLSLQYTRRQPNCHELPLHPWIGFSCFFFPILPRPSPLSSPPSTWSPPPWFTGNFSHPRICPASNISSPFHRPPFWCLFIVRSDGQFSRLWAPEGRESSLFHTNAQCS